MVRVRVRVRVNTLHTLIVWSPWEEARNVPLGDMSMAMVHTAVSGTGKSRGLGGWGLE